MKGVRGLVFLCQWPLHFPDDARSCCESWVLTVIRVGLQVYRWYGMAVAVPNHRLLLPCGLLRAAQA